MRALCYLLNKFFNAVVMLEILHLLTSLQLSCNTVVHKELIGSQLTKEHSHLGAWVQICGLMTPASLHFQGLGRERASACQRQGWAVVIAAYVIHVQPRSQWFILYCVHLKNVLNTVLHQFLWGDGLIILEICQGYIIKNEGWLCSRCIVRTRNNSAAEHICCYSKGPRFSLQHPHWAAYSLLQLQLQGTGSPFGLYEHPYTRSVQHRHIHKHK